jgi:trans-2,3-dihydro-3-hydroxyanthranilate isomerase
MTRTYEFQQVDVFTDRIFGGNPLAVFLDGRGLSGEEMQAIALEMNLSETTFVLPPEDDAHLAKVRIFTPRAELPFAGHPTVGTTWVLARQGRIPAGVSEAVLELGVGPIGVTLEGASNDPTFVWMHQGRPTFGEVVDNRRAVAQALNVDESDLAADLPVQFVATGMPVLFVPFASKEAVDRAAVSGFDRREVDSGSAFLFHSEPGSKRAYSRMVVSIGGTVWEDPATGAASGPLGAYIVNYGLASGAGTVAIVSEQGVKMGRQSFVHIRVAVEADGPGEISIGGSVVPVFEGVLTVPA